MTKKIVLWGASGHARVLGELVAGQGFQVVALFDNDTSARTPFAEVPLYHGPDGFRAWRAATPAADIACLSAIGGAKGRDRIVLQQLMAAAGLQPIVAIHQTAFVARTAHLGPGSQVLAQAAICADAITGAACIINTSSSVDHECELGDGVHVAPGATLAGCVKVGPYTLIGAGAVVLPRVRIGANVIVGAGSVVSRDIPDNMVVYGAPARRIRSNPPPS